MATKLVLTLVCLLVAGVEIISSKDTEFGHFIEYKESEQIMLEKLNRELSREDMGADEREISLNVVKELARAMDKSDLNAVAGKYSVYELLDMNTYWKNYMHYCSQSEAETRQRRCDYLSENERHENLAHYCLYCASQYFEMCQRSIPEILTKRILDKSQLTPLQLKNIKLLDKEFRAWILRGGDERKSDKFNFQEFFSNPENIPSTWISIKKTCMKVFEQLADVLYFDSKAKLSVEYLKSRLPDKDKNKAVVGHCGTYIRVSEPKLSEHQLLKGSPDEIDA